MGRRKGQPVHGWIILDKPYGMSSSQAVGRVRHALDAAKAGHAGTLDPLATGVLPIALGEATKTIRFVMDGAKTYRFTIRWGEARATDDSEGEVTATSAVRPTADAIRAALPAFTGTIRQAPPRYSAVKIDGKRAYDRARSAEDFTPEPRAVRIDRLALIDLPDADHARLELGCGKGVYVRSLARDLAAALGTVGHVAALRRTRAGPFAESRAISLDKLTSNGHSPRPLHLVLPVETALDDIPALALTAAQAGLLRMGRSLPLCEAGGRVFDGLDDLDTDGIACAVSDGRAVALVRVTRETIQPVRVLNES